MPEGHPINLINLLFAVVLLYFAVVIFLPAVYILRYFTGFNIFISPAVGKAILSSFFIGAAVTCLNLVFGIPIAWVLARSRNRITRWIDNLIDLSLVMPTAALGFSVYLYWGSSFGFWKIFGWENGIVSRGMSMIILLHLIFTLPYMIRSLVAAIQQLESQFEEAAVTLGASQFTFFRTVAMPLFRDGVINGSVLSFTRSLSETGATVIVAGAFMTAPVLIISLKDSGDWQAAAGVSIFLIIFAVIILFSAKLLLGERRINLSRVYSGLERSVSGLTSLKNLVIFLFFAVFIFLPTIQILFFSLSSFSLPADIIFIYRSLIFSLGLALIITLINFIFAVPFSYLIARNRFGIGTIMDTLGDVVLLVPTGALGLSLSVFWRQFLSSDFIILLLAHLSFTFPLLVKPITSAIREVSASQEEASYSLGAGAGKTLTRLLLPQIKPAIIAGCIMAFMRSISETGATLAVTRNLKTVTVLIVDLFTSGNLKEAAFACTLLFIIAFVFLLYLKKANNRSLNTA